MKIITGNANPVLAHEIAEHCFAALVPTNISTFADGETSVEFLENIRGEDVFIIQSTATPVNDSLMELLIIHIILLLLIPIPLLSLIIMDVYIMILLLLVNQIKFHFYLV